MEMILGAIIYIESRCRTWPDWVENKVGTLYRPGRISSTVQSPRTVSRGALQLDHTNYKPTSDFGAVTWPARSPSLF